MDYRYKYTTTTVCYLCESEKERVHDDRRVAKGLLS